MKLKISSLSFLILTIFVGSNTLALTVSKVSYLVDKETITYTNGTSAVFSASSAPVKWGTDHVTKTTTYTFADGSKNAVVSKVPGTAGTPTYVGNVQNIVTTYGDGATSTATKTATSSAVKWGTDHVTKTTTYTFADGSKNAVVSTVPGTVGTPTYSGGTQTIVTTYGDGTKATVNNTAASAPVTWGTDHVTKTTTYTFANGATNPVVNTVNPTSTTPTLAPASYPANWTTNGTVTGPNVSSFTTTYGDGYVSTVQDGTSSKPFLQATLATLSSPITDPNAIVKTPSSAIYDLTWGTPDKLGPYYANLFNSGSFTFNSYFQVMNHIISGQCQYGYFYKYCTNGATVSAPHPEVIDAWKQGWTGKGVNILMVDGYQATIGNGSYGGDSHGITTMLIAQRYAVGANLYGLDYTLNKTTGSPLGLVSSYSGAVAASATINVINMSFGANYWSSPSGHTGSAITSSDISYVVNTYSPQALMINNLLDGTNATGGFAVTNAVIVKSAGNDAANAYIEPFVGLLAANPKVSPRLLIVGALNRAGSTSAPASIAQYSNYAGSNTTIQSRFLVASGTVPFTDGSVAVDGTPITASGNEGTSYAAPRVAGYAAIVMQKFPKLSGANTADIMLQTARYDTLSCNPNCDKAIYGQGEASLSRALAPVGRLR